ncbi:hypothetical protein LJC21_02745 [Bacteroides sp. OttesenSCG-928-E20]|nr:hypothetical protein [Bacteroides sp. OttesenSCG-928-E20]
MYYLLLSLWAGSLESEKMNAIHAKSVNGTLQNSSDQADYLMDANSDSDVMMGEPVSDLPLQ